MDKDLNRSSDYLRIPFKVILIGDANVGKTCLINRFVNDSYSKESPTIGIDFVFKTMSV